MATPMMLQWQECKNSAPDALLLFRMGDFYEAFYEDAALLSEIGSVALTKRQDVPMSGIPVASLETFLDKLVAENKKVAIAEQLAVPDGKGIVPRGIVRVVSPGTYTTSPSLEEKSNLSYTAFFEVDNSFSLAVIDLSTLSFKTTYLPSLESLLQELERISPKELATSPKELDAYPALFKKMELTHGTFIQKIDPSPFISPKEIDKHLFSAFILRNFLKKEYHIDTSTLPEPTLYFPESHLLIDFSSAKHLNLFKESGKTHGFSLFDYLNHNKTPMGKRLLLEWIKRPLAQKKPIDERLEAVLELTQNGDLFHTISSFLSHIKDVERIATKISQNIQPKELVALQKSLEGVSSFIDRKNLFNFSSDKLNFLCKNLNPHTPCIEQIAAAICHEKALQQNDPYALKEGYSKELDSLKKLQSEGDLFLERYQERLREETGIRTLKVSYTKAFGYYIEVSRAQASKMPVSFYKKQTLTQTERFITEELKDFEAKIISAESKMRALEKELYKELSDFLSSFTPSLLILSQFLAELDVLYSFAKAATLYKLTKPLITEENELHLKDARHPLVEKTLGLGVFTPNDCILGSREGTLMYLITGPNMAGKSTYMRQIALNIIMAQMGCFVAARYAEVGITDRIFTRIGAHDDLEDGRSTFMVEMTEAAEILKYATARSFVILDEIGRGTSTVDGVSIALAMAEFFLDKGKFCPKILFSTHFFELIHIEENYPIRVQNWHFAVLESKEGISFLHKLEKGCAKESYGIHVAEIAGVLPMVVKRAKAIQKKLDLKEKKRGIDKKNIQNIYELPLFSSQK